MQKIDVAIIGASGYTGLELIKLILNHPIFELSYLATSQGESRVDILHPALKSVCNMEVEKVNFKKFPKNIKLAFLALPHKSAMEMAKELLKRDIKVVDLSADYRLELDTYESNYCPHIDKENLSHSIYGLIEFYKDDIKKARLVASPGCYPTATLLGVLPFIPYLKDNSAIFIDAKSGVSGAGKKLTHNNSFVTINENIFAYNPLKHRHAPEIKEKINKIYNKEFQINFVPHLIPTTRGELVSIYASLKEDIKPLEILEEFYKDSKFIRVRENPVDIKSVSGTHFCDIFAMRNSDSLFISSAIDNLLRGAASQALVAANLMFGLKEESGVPTLAYVP